MFHRLPGMVASGLAILFPVVDGSSRKRVLRVRGICQLVRTSLLARRFPSSVSIIESVDFPNRSVVEIRTAGPPSLGSIK
jgi:hypothetical protein